MILEAAVCLAMNVYHEARGEPVDGQIAVAQVTMNRVESPLYPDDVCAVVTHDTGPHAWDCQFSWWCDGKSDTPTNPEDWAVAQEVARIVLAGEGLAREDFSGGATHYYAHDKTTPVWSEHPTFTLVGVIAGHTLMVEDRFGPGMVLASN